MAETHHEYPAKSVAMIHERGDNRRDNDCLSELVLSSTLNNGFNSVLSENASNTNSIKSEIAQVGRDMSGEFCDMGRDMLKGFNGVEKEVAKYSFDLSRQIAQGFCDLKTTALQSEVQRLRDERNTAELRTIVLEAITGVIAPLKAAMK